MSAAVATATGVQESAKARSQFARAWARFRRNKLALASLVVVVLLLLVAIFAPFIAPYGYDETNYAAQRVPPGTDGYLLGTDQLGRDILSRLIYSLRTAFVIAIGAEVIAMFLAIVIGMTAGFVGGRVDNLLMAMTDILFVFPSYLLIIILVTVFGRSELTIFVAIGISSWVGTARLVRAEVLRLRVREFVEAGKAMGASGFTISLRYILPNSLGPLLVALSFGIPGAIIAESGLALLGLGVQPPTPSLGTMILEGQQWVLVSPHMLIWPAGLFALTMLAFTWIGDGLRDAFDPQE
jgi:ABC-type dipeptide/oligopeptide/nickel transport system permease subunit